MTEAGLKMNLVDYVGGLPLGSGDGQRAGVCVAVKGAAVMKAAYIEQTGPPEVLVFGERPMPRTCRR